MPANPTPVLWHLKVSHYNEKARWALDHKRLPHVRRAITPGSHPRIARKLTGGQTFPILVLDGEPIGDSTEIIAALERHQPDPPLYPADDQTRDEALALEDFFDEQFGPHTRLLTVEHMLGDPDLFIGGFSPDLTPGRRRLARAAFPLVKKGARAGLHINAESIEEAWTKIAVAGERFRSELRPSGYLAGDDFTVADLTLAALVAPPLAPPQFLYPQPQRGHPLVEPVRQALDETGISEWALEIYAKHRGESAEIPRT